MAKRTRKITKFTPTQACLMTLLNREYPSPVSTSLLVRMMNVNEWNSSPASIFNLVHVVSNEPMYTMPFTNKGVHSAFRTLVGRGYIIADREVSTQIWYGKTRKVEQTTYAMTPKGLELFNALLGTATDQIPKVVSGLRHVAKWDKKDL